MDVQNVIEAQEREPNSAWGSQGRPHMGIDEKVGAACAKTQGHKRKSTFEAWQQVQG